MLMGSPLDYKWSRIMNGRTVRGPTYAIRSDLAKLYSLKGGGLPDIESENAYPPLSDTSIKARNSRTET